MGRFKEILRGRISYVGRCLEHTKKTTTASSSKNAIKVYQTTIDNKGCVACGKDHKLFFCIEFKKMKPKTRWELAKRAKLCFSCLKPNHDKSTCSSKTPCNVNNCLDNIVHGFMRIVK